MRSPSAQIHGRHERGHWQGARPYLSIRGLRRGKHCGNTERLKSSLLFGHKAIPRRQHSLPVKLEQLGAERVCQRLRNTSSLSDTDIRRDEEYGWLRRTSASYCVRPTPMMLALPSACKMRKSARFRSQLVQEVGGQRERRHARCDSLGACGLDPLFVLSLDISTLTP